MGFFGKSKFLTFHEKKEKYLVELKHNCKVSNDFKKKTNADGKTYLEFDAKHDDKGNRIPLTEREIGFREGYSSAVIEREKYDRKKFEANKKALESCNNMLKDIPVASSASAKTSRKKKKA